MRRDQHPLAAQDGGRNGIVPCGQDPRHGVLEAFGQRHHRGVGIAAIAAFAAWIASLQGRRRSVVTASPDQDLLVAVLACHVRLVESLQGPVMPFIEPPVFDHRQPGAVHFVEREPQGADGTLEHRGETHVEVPALGLEQLSGREGLLHAHWGQVHIRPAGETVFQIPGGFAVADQNKLVHGAGRDGEKSGDCPSILESGSGVQTFHGLALSV